MYNRGFGETPSEAPSTKGSSLREKVDTQRIKLFLQEYKSGLAYWVGIGLLILDWILPANNLRVHIFGNKRRGL